MWCFCAEKEKKNVLVSSVGKSPTLSCYLGLLRSSTNYDESNAPAAYQHLINFITENNLLTYSLNEQINTIEI